MGREVWVVEYHDYEEGGCVAVADSLEAAQSIAERREHGRRQTSREYGWRHNPEGKCDTEHWLLPSTRGAGDWRVGAFSVESNAPPREP